MLCHWVHLADHWTPLPHAVAAAPRHGSTVPLSQHPALPSGSGRRDGRVSLPLCTDTAHLPLDIQSLVLPPQGSSLWLASHHFFAASPPLSENVPKFLSSRVLGLFLLFPCLGPGSVTSPKSPGCFLKNGVSDQPQEPQ
ncbi:hypothetical protein GHT09_013815 [Marmota monax]|uniref:Uncharacterized protein n=1 Tax=Marmota monax TaxID=9995 RepID=A0A834UKE6_MARMO|nr:hypothetical protein GHT09_013815 [Marmota monax]